MSPDTSPNISVLTKNVKMCKHNFLFSIELVLLYIFVYVLALLMSYKFVITMKITDDLV